jgi:geranylgeranyl diphosphate synthase type II
MKDHPHAPKDLYAPVDYMLGLGGKRMRPLLVLLAHGMFSKRAKNAIPAALAMELFHNFTLVHDDIMDKAVLRRNKTTVHKKWNDNVAILSGDVMLVYAYRELGKVDKRYLPEALELFSRTAAEVCEGQQMDMDFEKRNDVRISDYLRMIELKTAVLLGACLQTGAILGGAGKKDAKALYEFGKNTGIAFQLMDDLLDAYGDEKIFGKQKGGDILANKKTFLSLNALERAGVKERKKVAGILFSSSVDAAGKIEQVLHTYDRLNVREHTESMMKRYYSFALKHLETVKVPSPAKVPLLQVASLLLDRKK